MGTETRMPTPLNEALTPGEEHPLPERWRAQRKTELVLRLLRSEALEDLSRANQVPSRTLGRPRGRAGSGPLDTNSNRPRDPTGVHTEAKKVNPGAPTDRARASDSGELAQHRRVDVGDPHLRQVLSQGEHLLFFPVDQEELPKR